MKWCYHWLYILVVGKSRKGKRTDKKGLKQSGRGKELVEDKDEPSKEEFYHISSEDEDSPKGMKSKTIFITGVFCCLVTNMLYGFILLFNCSKCQTVAHGSQFLIKRSSSCVAYAFLT